MQAGPPPPDRKSRWRGQRPVQPPRSRVRPFADRELDPHRFAAAPNRDVNDRADAVRPERSQQRTHAGELLVVPADDNIALPDAGGGRWARSIDAHHHRADPVVELDGLQPNPEIAPRDPAMGFKSSGDPADRRARNDKNASHPLDCYANRLAGGSKGKAPLVAVSQPYAELDPSVY